MDPVTPMNNNLKRETSVKSPGVRRIHADIRELHLNKSRFVYCLLFLFIFIFNVIIIIFDIYLFIHLYFFNLGIMLPNLAKMIYMIGILLLEDLKVLILMEVDIMVVLFFHLM